MIFFRQHPIMRLVNVITLGIEEFIDNNNAPEYAVLSHTWSKEEITFQEWNDGKNAAKKSGYAKISGAYCQTSKDRLNYVWVDTNCIDKTSSAELSEAINSMFAWYRASKVCYVYLADVTADGVEDIMPALRISRWFTRGWTLQELLAPENVVFFSRDWIRLGTKIELAKEISAVTGIHQRYLQSSDAIFSASVAGRMSWMRNRVTTRVEDIAYCMLGIFKINMTLLYGEGANAFLRLQEEIIKISDDQTIFCWGFVSSDVVPPTWQNILAPHPAAFSYGRGFIPRYADDAAIEPYAITNAGLSISLPVVYTCEGICAILDVAWDEETEIDEKNDVSRASEAEGRSPSTANWKARGFCAAIHLGMVGNRGHYIRVQYPPVPIPIIPSRSRRTKQLFLRCRGITKDQKPVSSTTTAVDMVPATHTNRRGEALFLTFDRAVTVKGTFTPGDDNTDDTIAPLKLDRAGSSVWMPQLGRGEPGGERQRRQEACLSMVIAESPLKGEKYGGWGVGAVFIAKVCSDPASSSGRADRVEAREWYTEVAGVQETATLQRRAPPTSTLSGTLEKIKNMPPTSYGPFSTTIITQLPRLGELRQTRRGRGCTSNFRVEELTA
ncbi:heterokaryon incompatibility protein-domain-containing protein [Lasiosphaeria miniovina]|uniref:Heterokaryon incompatibility protein-domain-containing protein n=1 Tax=Lasiosphaeria miniovina TaxID=1954250 RepID=A0AA40B633_9PEZI|nr:heterokaryon incompatibility protein-domain-containing protein [Lasiosphaeria miniovina]KAK0728308.1 heterokaryon incompatibility protein-domain-containing protein [Lasiosphaeria miniovina]